MFSQRLTDGGASLLKGNTMRTIARQIAKPARQLTDDELKKVGGGSTWTILCGNAREVDNTGND